MHISPIPDLIQQWLELQSKLDDLKKQSDKLKSEQEALSKQITEIIPSGKSIITINSEQYLFDNGDFFSGLKITKLESIPRLDEKALAEKVDTYNEANQKEVVWSPNEVDQLVESYKEDVTTMEDLKVRNR